MDLRTEIDFVVRRELLSMPGIAAISVYGGESQQFVVEPDPERLEQLGISLDQILIAAKNSTGSISGGFTNYSGKEYTIRGFGRAANAEQIGQAFVKNDNQGYPVMLRDVADVSTKAAPLIGAASVNAEPGIILVISKDPGANTIELTHNIENRLNEIASTMADDVTVYTDLFQQAHFIDIAINNVRSALLISGILVVFILFIFLTNWRATLISLVAVPVSVTISILVLWIAGMTFNTMTLGGIAIAIGVLVDDAIVFVENVFRRLRENAEKPEAEQQRFLTIIIEASSQIKGPIVLVNFTIVIVFLPLFFLTGLVGSLLMPLGIAYVTTIVASLLVALILTPAMSAWLLADSEKQSERTSWLPRKLEELYKPILIFCFKFRMMVLAAIAVIFIAALWLIPGIGRSFLPEFNEGTLNVGMATMPGINVSFDQPITHRIDHMLTGVHTNLAVKVYGPDRLRLQSLSHDIESLMHTVGNLEDILTDNQIDVPQFQIVPDREQLAMHGLSIGRFGDIVEMAFRGVVLDQIYLDPAVFDLVVRFSDEHRASPEAISRTTVELPDGSHIRIAGLIGFITLFGIAIRNGIILIDRYNKLISKRTMVIRNAVILGGLLSATLLNMIVIPLLFDWYFSKTDHDNRL